MMKKYYFLNILFISVLLNIFSLTASDELKEKKSSYNRIIIITGSLIVGATAGVYFLWKHYKQDLVDFVDNSSKQSLVLEDKNKLGNDDQHSTNYPQINMTSTKGSPKKQKFFNWLQKWISEKRLESKKRRSIRHDYMKVVHNSLTKIVSDGLIYPIVTPILKYCVEINEKNKFSLEESMMYEDQFLGLKIDERISDDSHEFVNNLCDFLVAEMKKETKIIEPISECSIEDFDDNDNQERLINQFLNYIQHKTSKENMSKLPMLIKNNVRKFFILVEQFIKSSGPNKEGPFKKNN